MSVTGKCWKFGDNIDTDLIIPARYLNTSDPAELAKHVMEDADPEFAKQVKPGEIIVAGDNFGCGSSREHAPIAIKAAGVACVVAPFFARIFYRNAFNMGLPILECEEAAREAATGDELSVDFSTGVIRNATKGKSYQATPIPPFMQELISAGGLINYTRNKIGKAS
ncbi:MAG: 3-isopropylmalate dehydratase small subunit [Nitrospinae bacterium]|nr:3-isopropylmalate dehydratase small subunit [Nitrospinota bacterium]